MGQSEVCAKAGPLVALKGFEESPGCVKVTEKRPPKPPNLPSSRSALVFLQVL